MRSRSFLDNSVSQEARTKVDSVLVVDANASVVVHDSLSASLARCSAYSGLKLKPVSID